jgi:hypothetical protein
VARSSTPCLHDAQSSTKLILLRRSNWGVKASRHLNHIQLLLIFASYHFSPFHF